MIASAALAAVVHGWLAGWQPSLAPAAIVAFAFSFGAARVAFRPALAVVLGTAYVSPALLHIAFGVTDYHLLLVWLSAFTGVLFAKLDWRRWHVPQPWRVPLAAWALVVAATWPLIAGREVDFSLAAVHTINVATPVFSAPPPVAAAFVAIFALGQLLALLFLDFLWQEFGSTAPAAFVRAVVAPTIAGIGVGCGAGLYQALIDITWLNPLVWSSFGRAGGLALDANTFGTGAAIWAPLGIAAAWWTQQYRGLAIGAFVLLAAGMWTSGSRTALLVLSLGTVGIIVGLLQQRGLWRPRVARIGVAVLAIVVVIALAVVPRDFNSSSGLGRAFARLPRLNAAEIARFAEELWNRFDYGGAADRMIAEHPLTGVGIGAFHVLAPEYIYEKSGGYRFVGGDNAQNWWRHQLAELGVIGALPSLWLSLLVLWLLVRGESKLRPPAVTTIVRMVILGVGAASLVGVPTVHPATMVSVAIGLFFAGVTMQPERGRSDSGVWWTTAFAIMATTTAGQLMSANAALRPPHRAVALGVPYTYGMAPVEGLSANGEMRWIESGALAVRPVERRWFEMTFWHPRPSPSSPPVEVRVRRDGQEVLRRSIPAASPESFFFEVPPDRRSLIFEFTVSPAHTPHALGFAQRWHDDLPPGTTAQQVVR